MSINIYPNTNVLNNEAGEVIGEAGKDALQVEDRLGNPELAKMIEELKLTNEYLAEMLGDRLGD